MFIGLDSGLKHCVSTLVKEHSLSVAEWLLNNLMNTFLNYAVQCVLHLDVMVIYSEFFI